MKQFTSHFPFDGGTKRFILNPLQPFDGSKWRLGTA
jgi:hypothetical protein